MRRRKSMEKVSAERILELRKGHKMDLDSFISRLITFSKADIEESHDFCRYAVTQGAIEFDMQNHRLVKEVLRKIDADKKRYAPDHIVKRVAKMHIRLKSPPLKVEQAPFRDPNGRLA